MRSLFSWISLITFLAVGFAIGSEITPSRGHHPQEPSKTGAVVDDYANFIKRLRAAGVAPLAGGRVEQPFFSITGTMIKVYGEDVQVFAYADAAAADAAAAPISPDGMAVGTRKIFWVGAPHFFKQGRLLILYVGDNEKVLGALAVVLGRQFAGR